MELLLEQPTEQELAPGSVCQGRGLGRNSKEELRATGRAAETAYSGGVGFREVGKEEAPRVLRIMS